MTKRVQKAQKLETYTVESESTLKNEFIGDVKAGFPSPASEFSDSLT